MAQCRLSRAASISVMPQRQESRQSDFSLRFLHFINAALSSTRLAQVILGELARAITLLADVVALFGLHALVTFVFRVLLIRIRIIPLIVCMAVKLFLYGICHTF